MGLDDPLVLLRLSSRRVNATNKVPISLGEPLTRNTLILWSIPSMAVSRIFFSFGFSRVISGNTFEFKITRSEPAVLMIMRELLPDDDLSSEDRRRLSLSLSGPRPLSSHDDVFFSKMCSFALIWKTLLSSSSPVINSTSLYSTFRFLVSQYSAAASDNVLVFSLSDGMVES